MKLLATLSLSAALVSSAYAVSYSYQPSDVDMNDLDHYTPVVWGFNLNAVESALSNKMKISKVTLSFKNIRNWNNDQNALFVNLIDNPWTGSSASTSVDLKYFSNENARESKFELSNYFTNTSKYSLTGSNAGQAVSYLTTFSDTKWGNAVENWSYDFTQSQINTLVSYLGTSAGVQKKKVRQGGQWVWVDDTTKPRWDIGLGFDADCHYWNDGVKLTIETARVPDAAATLGLFGAALAGLALARRRRA